MEIYQAIARVLDILFWVFWFIYIFTIIYFRTEESDQKFENIVLWNFYRWDSKGFDPYKNYPKGKSDLLFQRQVVWIALLVMPCWAISYPFRRFYRKIQCCLRWVLRQS